MSDNKKIKVLEGQKSADEKSGADSGQRCSFCGKTAEEVTHLLAGKAVYICNECVGECDHILSKSDSSD